MRYPQIDLEPKSIYDFRLTIYDYACVAKPRSNRKSKIVNRIDNSLSMSKRKRLSFSKTA
jgi:hypothetical protein